METYQESKERGDAMKQIKIIITDKGTTVETDGYTGESCLDASGELIKKLKQVGIEATVENIELKEEYYEQNKDFNENRQ